MGNLKLSEAEKFNRGHTELASGRAEPEASESVLPFAPKSLSSSTWEKWSFLHFAALWN